MPAPDFTHHRNGNGPNKTKAPSLGDGAFRFAALEAPDHLPKPRPTRTVFPPNAAADSQSSRLYQAYRHELAGISLTRWLIWLLTALAIVAATPLLPGPWWLGGIALLPALWLAIMVVTRRSRDFVRFDAQPTPALTPQKLDSADKIPAHVTGHFSVEGQYMRYTWLPGFYRTFSTREHALLCLVRPRRFARIGIWPPEQAGMWYIFFTPPLVRAVRYGRLYFERKPRPAVAVTYELTISRPGRKEKVAEETVYIACADEAAAHSILADLLVEERERSDLPVSSSE
ncbi:MAG: hypothetical protein KDD92_02080 [Caldilineaceae bacterium]|nr:hypothetical protein [Caldilineaceae bacterium]